MNCEKRPGSLCVPGLLGLLWAACTPAAQAGDLAADVAADYPRLEALFHHFHTNPELSMQEFKTSDRMAAELAAEGFEVTRGIAKTGLVGILRNGDGPVVMIRADMDGLPVQEKSGLPYASLTRQVNLDGVDMPVMHACGHDMHITSLIGVARQLRARKADWRGTLMLLVQPAEENLDGAYNMIMDNLYGRVPRGRTTPWRCTSSASIQPARSPSATARCFPALTPSASRCTASRPTGRHPTWAAIRSSSPARS